MLKKLLLLILLSPLIILAVVGGWMYYTFYNKPLPANFQFQIPQGASVSEIASKLKDSGVIDSELMFKWYAKFTGFASKLQAGDYQLPAGLTGPQLMTALTQGKMAKQEKVVVVKEGQTNKEIEKYLVDNSLINDGSFTARANILIKDLPDELKQKYNFLSEAPTKVDLEGYLFPDTYRLFAEDGGDILITKMLDNFQVKVDESIRSDIKAQGQTLYQILIMASLLEKEVRGTNDMKLVSGLFWNRLRDGQRLESCATLAYLLGENKPIYSLADTQIDSPYNTYRHDGLPPTPIGNPGIEAIKAAVYPTVSEYKFFLSRSDTGETVFARTYEEHLANKNKYLK